MTWRWGALASHCAICGTASDYRIGRWALGMEVLDAILRIGE